MMHNTTMDKDRLAAFADGALSPEEAAQISGLNEILLGNFDTVGEGLVLAAVAGWAVVTWTLDNWPGDVDDPSIFYADDSRDPSKEK